MATNSVNIVATLPGSNTPLVRASGATDTTWYSWFRAIQLRTGGNTGISTAQLQADDESAQVLAAAFQREPPKGRPALPFAVTPGASPFSYRAPLGGTVLIFGGTVSAVGLSRDGSTFFACPVAGPVPVFGGDVVKVTYSGAPTMTMIPA